MSILHKVLDYAERLPEGIERARDQIIGTPNLRDLIVLIISTRCNQAFWIQIVSRDKRHRVL